MIKKIYHTADWHLRNFQRQDEFIESINLLADQIKNENIPYKDGRICVTGDLFHNHDEISNEANLIMVKTIKTLLSLHPTIITIGNHDLPKNRTRMDAITPLVEAIDDPNLKFSKWSEIFVDDNVTFLHYSFLDNFAVQPPNKQPNQINVGLYHAPLQNCKTPLNPVFEKKMTEHQTKIDLFKGCDVVLMGDIHFPQILHGDGYSAYYCGSLYQQNFGEYVNHHGFGVLNVEDLSYKFVEIANSYGKYKVKLEDINELKLQFLNLKSNERKF